MLLVSDVHTRVRRKEQLDEVNFVRRGNRYLDEEAAQEIYGDVMKKDLTSTPFVVLFDPGMNTEGYWTYNHAVLQAEDCFDCLKVLHLGYKHVFLFDSSSGHAKKRSDGLDARKMNVSYGGKQAVMRATKIESVDGCLGPYPSILTEGSEQKMIFEEGDVGPFWMSPEEREASKVTRFIGEANTSGREVPKTKEELYKELNDAGVELGRFINKIRKAELIEKATLKGIPINKQSGRNEIEGWVGKPKGLLQVLWERGWIDEGQLQEYKKEHPEQHNFSLVTLMESCLDFAREISRLQRIAERYKMQVIMTPKYHAEIAGVGIEYCWGAAKSFYRKISFSEKKTKQQFRRSVMRSLQTLSKQVVRKADRKVRCYIETYYCFDVLGMDPDNNTERQGGRLEDQQEATDDGDGNPPAPQKEIIPLSTISLPMIEKMKDNFKCHRCALNFNKAFCISLIASGGDDENNVNMR